MEGNAPSDSTQRFTLGFLLGVKAEVDALRSSKKSGLVGRFERDRERRNTEAAVGATVAFFGAGACRSDPTLRSWFQKLRPVHRRTFSYRPLYPSRFSFEVPSSLHVLELSTLQNEPPLPSVTQYPDFLLVAVSASSMVYLRFSSSFQPVSILS